MSIHAKKPALTTIFTGREFNQGASEAKNSSLAGPVINTRSGRPSSTSRAMLT